MPRLNHAMTSRLRLEVLMGIWFTGRPVVALNKHHQPVGLLHPDKTTESGLRFERRSDAMQAAFEGSS